MTTRGAQARAGRLPGGRARRRARSAPSRTTCSRTSASRWSTSARPASTPASCCTCPTTRRRARCAAGTSRARKRAVGPRGRRGRHVQAARGAGGDLPAGAGPAPRRRRRRLLPHRRALRHTWFVLTHLLGFDQVRNYDGSWTEWGNPCGCRSRRAPSGVRRRTDRASPPAAAGRLAELVDDFAESGRSGCSCCWSSREELPALPERYTGTGPHGAGARVPVAASSWRSRSSHRAPDERRCTCSSRRRRRHRPRAGSRDPARGPGRAEPPPTCSRCPTTPYRARAGRGRQPAAAARHGRRCCADQEPGPAQGRRGRTCRRLGQRHPRLARDAGRCRRPRRSRRGERRRSTPGARSCAARAGPSSSGAATPACSRLPTDGGHGADLVDPLGPVDRAGRGPVAQALLLVAARRPSRTAGGR